jgi:hypothetical protein
LVPKKSLFLFFVIHRQTNTQKGIELSQVKAKLHLNQFEHIEQEFKAFFKDNNLCRRELLSKRECFNFIIKLINSQIISHESLTKAAISFYGMLKKSNAYSIPSILRNQVGNLLSRKFSAYLTAGMSLVQPLDETDSLILFTKADVWLTVAKLKEKQQFIDITQKNEDHIIDSMLGSFLSFKKSLSVLRGTPQTSQHQSTLKE